MTDGTDSATFQSAEVESFWRFTNRSLEGFMAAMEGLTVEELNWRPPAPDTNSIYVLATHTLGNVRMHVFRVLLGQSIDRDRDQEFRSVAEASNVPIPFWPSLQAEVAGTLAGLPDETMNAPFDHPVFGPLTGREVLMVMLRHTAEHLGQVELTRDLILAERG
ncbi:MAG: DinB family protein [Chloroflexia bacterium]|nr:DinB family protein [Chloroflexia bacterium]